jgi:hypothetical protein
MWLKLITIKKKPLNSNICCILNTAANVLKIKNLKFLNRFRKTTILDFPDKNQEEQSWQNVNYYSYAKNWGYIIL